MAAFLEVANYFIDCLMTMTLWGLGLVFLLLRLYSLPQLSNVVGAMSLVLMLYVQYHCHC